MPTTPWPPSPLRRRALRGNLWLLLISCLLTSATAQASEGKWMPQQVLELGAKWLQTQGFELPMAKLWDARNGGGLLANTVQLPGCSGSFVSSNGLLITNQHCVMRILQDNSTPQANLGRDGYVARTQADEKRSKAFRIHVPRAFRDVTHAVLAAIPAGADDLARFRAVEAAEKRLVADCEKKPATRCQFASFDGGLFYTLTEFTELTDVRLVYAPATAIADFGGQTDNWMWPRHAADVALVRAYADGKPYRPASWFPLSEQGVKPGDAVAVLGYPGRTWRGWLASEMAERQERYFPAARDLAAEWTAILEEEGKRSELVAIAVADKQRSLLNRGKNAEGQLAGLARGRLIDKQGQADQRVLQWATRRPGGQAGLDAHAGLTKLLAEKLDTWERNFLLDSLGSGAYGLYWPTLLARRAGEAQKPDIEREPAHMEREVPRLRERHERDQVSFAAVADRRLFASWVRRALLLPANQRLAMVDALFQGSLRTVAGRQTVDEAAVLARVTELNERSKVLELDVRKRMFDETPAQLAARKDPLLDLGLALDVALRELKERRDRWSGAEIRMRPTWRKWVIAQAGHPLAPDANATLRVTFGRVKGYAPRDAVAYDAQTTFAGALQKHTGKEPFDLTQRVRDAYASKGPGRYRDARLRDLPVDFLSDADTTGGNSGSPAIDGRGRLVGVNFDRVWENVANDFGYNPDIARNVNTDVRYLLWLLDVVEDAQALRAELTAAPLATPGKL